MDYKILIVEEEVPEYSRQHLALLQEHIEEIPAARTATILRQWSFDVLHELLMSSGRVSKGKITGLVDNCIDNRWTPEDLYAEVACQLNVPEESMQVKRLLFLADYLGISEEPTKPESSSPESSGPSD